MNSSDHREEIHPPASIWRLVTRRSQAIVTLAEMGSGPSLYCVHSIAGDVACYGGLAEALGTHFRIYGVQVPRSRMTAAFASSIQHIAQSHADALAEFQPEGPILLLGWSAGAIIALEMAKRLQAIGRTVPLIVALDGAPCNTGGGLKRRHPRYLLKLIQNLPRWLGCTLAQNPSPKALGKKLLARLSFRMQTRFPRMRNEQTLCSTSVEQTLSLEAWRPDQASFIRALYNAMRHYVPAPYAGRVLVLEAEVQPIDHLLQIGAAWIKIAPGAEIVTFCGNHEAVFTDRPIALVKQQLIKELSAA